MFVSEIPNEKGAADLKKRLAPTLLAAKTLCACSNRTWRDLALIKLQITVIVNTKSGSRRIRR